MIELYVCVCVCGHVYVCLCVWACIYVFVFVWGHLCVCSSKPGGPAPDGGETKGEAGTLEVHQMLEDPLHHTGRKPVALQEEQVRTYQAVFSLSFPVFYIFFSFFLCVYVTLSITHSTHIQSDGNPANSCPAAQFSVFWTCPRSPYLSIRRYLDYLGLHSPRKWDDTWLRVHHLARIDISKASSSLH